MPRNIIKAYAADLDVYQINAENKLGHDSLRDVFPQDSRSIPISVIFWSVAFLSICLCLRRASSLGYCVGAVARIAGYTDCRIAHLVLAALWRSCSVLDSVFMWRWL